MVKPKSKVKGNIILVRHGQRTNTGRNEEFELTKLGKKQCRRLGKRLKKIYEIDRIVSSPLKRCKQTTKIVNSYLKKEVVFDDSLIEISWKANRNANVNKKEKIAIKKFLNKIKKKSGNTLVVTSGNVIKYILSLILKIPYKEIGYLGHHASGLNHVVVFEDGFLQIININDSTHLNDKLRLGVGRNKPFWKK